VHFETPFSIAPSSSSATSCPAAGRAVVEVWRRRKRDLKAGEVLDEYGMYMTYRRGRDVEEMCAGRYLPEGLRQANAS